MKKILAVFVSTVVVATAALATGTGKPAQSNPLSGGKWSIRVFFGFNGGEVKDDVEIDNVYGAGVEYTLPNVGSGTSGKFAIGAEYNTSTEGLGDTKLDNWGVYAAYYMPLGQSGSMSGLEGLARAGYFNSKLHASGNSVDDSGFGFDLGLRYKFQKVYLELFYRNRPEVDKVSNSAIVFGVNFPLGN